MYSKLILSIGLLFFIQRNEAGDIIQQVPGGHVDAELQNAAQSLQSEQPKSGKSHKNFHNITDDKGTMALFSSKGPIQMELVKIAGASLKSYQPKLMVNMTDGKVTGVRKGDDIRITMKYSGSSGSGDFVVNNADITLVVSVGGKKLVRQDYWQLTGASMTVAYSYKSNQKTATIDLMPKWGYSSRKSDWACGAGYSVCAPMRTAWTCKDQTLKLVNFTASVTDTNSVVLHIPGMQFQPFKSDSQSQRFGYSWDCDPLIPISIWSTFLVTLLLAAIVIWAIAMVTGVFTPSKFDDPKGPSIQIPNTD